MCYTHYQALWIPRVSKQSTVMYTCWLSTWTAEGGEKTVKAASIWGGMAGIRHVPTEKGKEGHVK